MKYNHRNGKLPKDEYFKVRLEECEKAGLSEKAAYYRQRLNELAGSPAAKSARYQTFKPSREAFLALSREDRVVKAIEVLEGEGLLKSKTDYLKVLGIAADEYLEALDKANIRGEI